jgi:hypothetical protein
LSLISRPVHGIGRLGVDGPPDKESFLGHNITFVNCSAANPFVDKKKEIRLDVQWHQYYRLVPEVRNDICGAMLGLTTRRCRTGPIARKAITGGWIWRNSYRALIL